MEYIDGKNVYEGILSYDEKKTILEKLVNSLDKLHKSETVPSDAFSLKKAYFDKTMDRLRKVQYLVLHALNREITINGRKCKYVMY